jgi:hypothetical protein
LLDSLPERVDTTTVGPDGSVTYGTDGEEKLAVAKRIEEWFPGGDPWALRPPGSPELVGTRLDVGRLEESGLSVFLKEARLYQDVDLTGDSIPVRLGGYLFGGARGSEILAISVNGVVGAVTRSYRQGEQVSFLAMVPPTVFVEGRNDIAVIEVLSRDELRLVRPRT